MTSVHINCIFIGESFYPKRLEQLSGMKLTNKEEKNSIATYGGYSGKNVSQGSAMIESDDLDWILDQLSKNIEFIRQSGVTDIMLTVTLAYTDQCNWEFSSQQLRIMADLEIPLAISCYRN